MSGGIALAWLTAILHHVNCLGGLLAFH